MPVIPLQPPLEASREFDEIVKAASMFERQSIRPRPMSEMTDTTYIMDTDVEYESDTDEQFRKRSFDSDDGRRRSLTTISSYDEVTTPGLHQTHQPPFELRFLPVEGPKGPHLFRSSQASSEFYYEHALQMSPLFPKEMTFPSDSAPVNDPITPVARNIRDDFSIAAAMQAPSAGLSAIEDYVRSWSTQQVIDWMHEAGVDSPIIECFDIHDINGAVLLDLQFEDLKELDIPSYGKRRQLWTAISALRGDDQAFYSPPASLHDSTRRTPSRSRGYSSEERPITPTSGPRRRGRSIPKSTDVVTPAESASIVAIEQLLPKPHTCAKGERCAKWRKQQKAIQHLQESNSIGRFPVDSHDVARFYLQSQPAPTACTETHLPVNTSSNMLQPGNYTDNPLPTPGVVPSVVASSDLLGPGHLPEFTLHEDVLNQLGARDPQDNVKQFLNFQHMNSPTADNRPSTPPFEMFPPNPVSAFPAQQTRPGPPPRSVSSPHQQLKALPKLDIPRSLSADPQLGSGVVADTTQPWVCRSATASPARAYRTGTPASEMDVPVTNVPLGPVSRDTSQSVPPNMQYRPHAHSQSRPADRRRPSLAPVKEGEVFSPSSDSTSDYARPSMSSGHSTESAMQRARDPAHHSPETKHFSYGESCSHAGWMKKRRTKMLRHEWQDAHFRLKGSQLAMHANARLSTAAMDTINVDDYAVACSSVASSSKLGAAMKALSLKNSSDAGKGDPADPTAFAFQLVPAPAAERRQIASGKTHHFAVKTKDERIDWMREIMLAKALQQKGKGYEVEVYDLPK